VRRPLDIAAVIFVVAMVMLGVAAAIVVLRQPPRPVAKGTRHHYLDSPYQAMLFYKGQLDVQSNLGVGHAVPRDLSRAYERAGYQWVAVTDQNTLTLTSQFDTPNILAVPGTEMIYPFAHLLAYGTDVVPTATSIQQAVDFVHKEAGAVILARPKDPPAVTVDQALAVKGLDAIQVYDARLHRENPVVSDATDMWDQMLSRGSRLPAVIGDDTIDLAGANSTLGQTSVDVQVPELTPPLIYDAIRHGAFVDSTGVRVLGVDTSSGDRIRVITTDATSIQWYGEGGALLTTTNGPDGTYRVSWKERYVRAVALRGDGAKAWTQPVFVIP
jgi:hypothetical protein